MLFILQHPDWKYSAIGGKKKLSEKNRILLEMLDKLQRSDAQMSERLEFLGIMEAQLRDLHYESPQLFL